MKIKSPLDFITDTRWVSLCEKYRVSVKFRPKLLGGGISATAYTFGKKLVIKHVTCKLTAATARKLVKSPTDAVAKVFEVAKIGQDLKRRDDGTDAYGGHCYQNNWVVIQEFIPQKKLKVDEIESIADMINDLRYLRDGSGKVTEKRRKKTKTVLEFLISLNESDIRFSGISDLHEYNMFFDKKGKIKIIDIGCLDS